MVITFKKAKNRLNWRRFLAFLCGFVVDLIIQTVKNGYTEFLVELDSLIFIEIRVI